MSVRSAYQALNCIAYHLLVPRGVLARGLACAYVISTSNVDSSKIIDLFLSLR